MSFLSESSKADLDFIMGVDFGSGAMESHFEEYHIPNLDNRLEKLSEEVHKKISTTDMAKAVICKIEELSAKFQKCTTNIKNNISLYESGEIDKETAIANIKTCTNSIRKMIEILEVDDMADFDDQSFSDTQADLLSEYLAGYKKIVERRMVELNNCGDDSCVYISNMDSYTSNKMEATEASMQTDLFFKQGELAKQIGGSNKIKTANALYAQARKLYGMGSKERAYQHLARAKKLYEETVVLAKSHGRMKTSDRRVKSEFGFNEKLMNKTTVEDRTKLDVTDNMEISKLITLLENRIDLCIALKLQWDNKAGNKTLGELQKALHAERVSEKKRMKAEKGKERYQARLKKLEEKSK